MFTCFAAGYYSIKLKSILMKRGFMHMHLTASQQTSNQSSFKCMHFFSLIYLMLLKRLMCLQWRLHYQYYKKTILEGLYKGEKFSSMKQHNLNHIEFRLLQLYYTSRSYDYVRLHNRSRYFLNLRVATSIEIIPN